jgi:hypothetical protein
VNILSKRRPKIPTTSRTKFVASKEERSRNLRATLLTFRRLIREEVRLPTTITGDLSSWIFQLHGLKTETTGDKLRIRPPIEPDLASSMKWMEQIAGPESDPKTRKSLRAKVEEVKDHRTTAELTLLYREDSERFHSEFTQQAGKVVDALQIPEELAAISGFTSFEESLKAQRASRAFFLCLTMHKTHPVLLIMRAMKGDRQAVLDLVKVDKLFVHDRCTQDSIRKAEFQNDRGFLNQLARAQTFVPTLTAREMQHLYFYQLFLIEQWGAQLPAEHELWRILDPHGKEYSSLSAFEKDLQRARRGFQKMLDEVSAEVKDPKF